MVRLLITFFETFKQNIEWSLRKRNNYLLHITSVIHHCHVEHVTQMTFFKRDLEFEGRALLQNFHSFFYMHLILLELHFHQVFYCWCMVAQFGKDSHAWRLGGVIKVQINTIPLVIVLAFKICLNIKWKIFFWYLIRFCSKLYVCEPLNSCPTCSVGGAAENQRLLRNTVPRQHISWADYCFCAQYASINIIVDYRI